MKANSEFPDSFCIELGIDREGVKRVKGRPSLDTLPLLLFLLLHLRATPLAFLPLTFFSTSNFEESSALTQRFSHNEHFQHLSAALLPKEYLAFLTPHRACKNTPRLSLSRREGSTEDKRLGKEAETGHHQATFYAPLTHPLTSEVVSPRRRTCPSYDRTRTNDWQSRVCSP